MKEKIRILNWDCEYIAEDTDDAYIRLETSMCVGPVEVFRLTVYQWAHGFYGPGKTCSYRATLMRNELREADVCEGNCANIGEAIDRSVDGAVAFLRELIPKLESAAPRAKDMAKLRARSFEKKLVRLRRDTLHDEA